MIEAVVSSTILNQAAVLEGLQGTLPLLWVFMFTLTYCNKWILHVITLAYVHCPPFLLPVLIHDRMSQHITLLSDTTK